MSVRVIEDGTQGAASGRRLQAARWRQEVGADAQTAATMPASRSSAKAHDDAALIIQR